MVRPTHLLALLGVVLALGGCAIPPPPVPPALAPTEVSPQCVEPPEAEDVDAEISLSVGEAGEVGQERKGADNRSLCFVWQPVPAPSVKKGKKPGAARGCCQPQSLIYARCRSNIHSCRLGDTSPVQWYSCAKKMGNTSNQPVSGAIMVLDANPRRKMFTGHPPYVEEARKNGETSWQLRISHTNYDRQCRLDLDSSVRFDPQRMTVSFHSGPWSSWAHDLKVLGFILR